MSHKPHMTVEDLVLFYHVVEKGGFLRAAETLNLNQGRASRSIARLEEAYGTTLLYRDMRNIKLTRTGKIVFDMARDMLERMNQGHLDVQAECKDMVGSITLSVTTGFGNYWLVPLLGQFLNDHPEIEMIFKTDDRDDVNLMLGTADIEIVSAKPDYREALECELLCEYPLHIYASEDYLAQYGIPRCIEDLDHHKIIAWRNDLPLVPTERFNALLYVGRHLKPPRQGSIYVDGDLSLMTFASSGLGLILVPKFFTDNFPTIQRVHLADEDMLLSSCVNRKYIVHHRSLVQSARHQAVIEFIKKQARILGSASFYDDLHLRNDQKTNVPRLSAFKESSDK